MTEPEHWHVVRQIWSDNTERTCTILGWYESYEEACVVAETTDKLGSVQGKETLVEVSVASLYVCPAKFIVMAPVKQLYCHRLKEWGSPHPL